MCLLGTKNSETRLTNVAMIAIFNAQDLGEYHQGDLDRSLEDNDVEYRRIPQLSIRPDPKTCEDVLDEVLEYQGPPYAITRIHPDWMQYIAGRDRCFVAYLIEGVNTSYYLNNRFEIENDHDTLQYVDKVWVAYARRAWPNRLLIRRIQSAVDMVR